MRGIVALVCCTALGLADRAQAQAQPVRLEYRVVPQTGGFGAGNPITLAGPINGPVTLGTTPATRTMRFRVDCRVLDLLPNDSIHAAGLSTTDMHINATPTGLTSDTAIARGLISTNERTQMSTPPAGPNQAGDDPSAPDPNGRAGLCGPFRGGMANQNDNNAGVNGAIVGLSIPRFGPFVLTEVPQDLAGWDLSGVGSGPFLNGNEWYAVYVFTLTAGPNSVGSITYSVGANADPVSHNAFAYFNDGFAQPLVSTNYTEAMITVNIPAAIPAPGLVGLLAFAGVLGARRRRQ